MKVKLHEKIEKHHSHKHYSLTDIEVETEVVKENNKTVWVRLPDNSVIKRHKAKKIVK